LEQIKTGKALTEIEGHVEYTSYFKEIYGSQEEEGDWVTSKFINLRQLMKLLSPEKIEEWREEFGADTVRITNIFIKGSGDSDNSATIRIGDIMDGWVNASVSVNDANSKMLRCVNEIENSLTEVLGRINTYKKY
jgi:molybdopterin converting factor small subunit